jgi:N-methylhydantoinase B
LAALGAVRIGEREILDLGREVGWDALEQYAEDWFDYSEQRMIEAIRRLPSGKVTTHSAHDPFPGVPDGIPTEVTLTVDSEQARITVDLQNNPDCQPCGLNLTEACARTAAMVGIYNGIIDHSVPPNAGSFRRIEILVRENCCCGIPRHPFSCSVATTNLADRVSGPVQVAIAELADGFGMAETGPIIPAGMGVISGRDPRHDGTPFVNQIFLACTGGAGTPVSDGFLSIIHAGNAGMCRHDSIEIDELHHPMFVSHRYLVPDTEGAGRCRGAPSGYTEFGPIAGCTMDVLYTADGTINPALGTRGGLPGSRAKAQKRELDGSLTDLPGCHGVTLEPGERIVSYSAGGGGYGPPWERDPASVKHDVDEGWITRERAAEVYGLVVDAAGEIDREASEAKRRVLASAAGR